MTASTLLEFGGRVSVSYFADEVPATHATRLAAVVVWRLSGDPSARAGGVRRWLRRLRHKFGPLGLGLHFRWSVPDWSGTSGEDGEQETLYSRHRRVVRVLGRNYALPSDGRSLVLLIDEPRVTVRTLIAPVVPRPDGWPDRATEQQRADAAAEEQKAWEAALQSDPEVRAFMNDTES